ncbi:gfo/Idh/MocA family oxidoreductase [Paenibacillus sp. 5J-6]|uniref:Gfo/Idh/MocA family oxidoreductase n=1 Tax=Paenibacillus silvestris TaxID=2606219 RepID=A0A6L8V7B3_9BACL|nr:Gfo/Idh/MocA family oxidoreductase [Paenibacillus silvestris]MZQ85501.1 gfo/Idh/MocA family oxidoreductase [Paenibacillus silvestris]
MSNRKLRVGVVGLTVGASHVKDYASSDTVKEIVLCDVNELRLKEIGDKYNISKKYTDFDKMLKEENLDAISLAVPNFLHMRLSIQAMEAGVHVLCEKPMARNAAEGRKMLDASQKHNKKLMINFNQRFLHECQMLKSVIDEGKLGDIYYVRTLWQRRRGVPWWYPLSSGKEVCGGGALIDLGVHVLDRAMWFCGYPEPEWVLGNTFCKVSKDEAARKGIHNFELEDMGVAMFRMTNGAMLELEASWASNRENEAITTRIYGSKGGAVLHSVVGDRNASSNQVFLEISGVVQDIPLDDKVISKMPNVRQAFLDAIINDEEVPCTPQQGLKITQMLDMVYLSAENGTPVKFE